MRLRSQITVLHQTRTIIFRGLKNKPVLSATWQQRDRHTVCTDVLPAATHVHVCTRVCLRVREGVWSTSCRHACACVRACVHVCAWGGRGVLPAGTHVHVCFCVCLNVHLGVEMFLLKCVQFYHYCEFAAKKGTRDHKSQNMGRSSPPSEKICSLCVTNTRQARTGFEHYEPGSWREQRTEQTLHRCFCVFRLPKLCTDVEEQANVILDDIWKHCGHGIWTCETCKNYKN